MSGPKRLQPALEILRLEQGQAGTGAQVSAPLVIGYRPATPAADPPAVDPGDIPDPTTATTQEVAEAHNALLQSLRDAGKIA